MTEHLPCEDLAFGTLRNEQPVIHFPPRNSFHYSGWSRGSSLLCENCYSEVTSATNVKNVCESSWLGKARKSLGRWESWVIAPKFTAHLISDLFGAVRPSSVSLLVLRPCLIILGDQKFSKLHIVPACLPNSSWWLERASLGCIPVWVCKFACWLPHYYPLRPRSGSARKSLPYEGLCVFVICLAPSLLQVGCQRLP